jgi:hypothetical protein
MWHVQITAGLGTALCVGPDQPAQRFGINARALTDNVEDALLHRRQS